jgi:alanine racemase
LTPQAVLDVDLDAIAANWHFLRQQHPQGDVAAVMKADAYGLGAAHVGKRLYREGCRHFFTAHFDEALVLRKLLPLARIHVLNGLPPGGAAEFLAAGVTPVLGSLAEIAEWRAADGPPRRALLHVDTGMSRLGLTAAEIAVLADDPGLLDGIALDAIMTHLVSAELPDDPLNGVQIARFRAACARLPKAPTSIANSSGIFLGENFASDLARPGAALYGINPTPQKPNPMRQAVRLLARVLQVRDIAAGETVGYNATWRANRPSRIATVGVGYADGWLRSLSNQASACFDGSPVPLVGRVSMDLSTFDVTDHPAAGSGAWLELLGPHMPPDTVARAAGTNGYEILTSLGARYTRVVSGA